MKKSVALMCIVSSITTIAFASISSMYTMAQNIVETQNFAGYTEYWRYGGPNDPEPQLEHIIAYFDDNGDIARADAYNASNGSYSFKDQVEMYGPSSEQAFREDHILPFGGDFLSGSGNNSGSSGNSGSTGSSGNSGSSGGGSDGSGGGGGGSSIGNTGGGSNGGGGGVGYACTSVDDGQEFCEQIN